MPYDLSRLELLIVEPDLAVASTWRRLMGTLRLRMPTFVPDSKTAWATLQGEQKGASVSGARVDILICRWELPGEETGLALIERLRRDPESPAPFLPAILVTATVTRERLRQAIDAGAHEMLMLPLAPKAVESRLREMVERPRKFVRGGGFFGPDRRRQVRSDYAGPFRRGDDRVKT
jgi:two-component system, chemotaxis family, chemotaxis protein CheY